MRSNTYLVKTWYTPNKFWAKWSETPHIQSSLSKSLAKAFLLPMIVFLDAERNSRCLLNFHQTCAFPLHSRGQHGHTDEICPSSHARILHIFILKININLFTNIFTQRSHKIYESNTWGNAVQTSSVPILKQFMRRCTGSTIAYMSCILRHFPKVWGQSIDYNIWLGYIIGIQFIRFIMVLSMLLWKVARSQLEVCVCISMYVPEWWARENQ